MPILTFGTGRNCSSQSGNIFYLKIHCCTVESFYIIVETSLVNMGFLRFFRRSTNDGDSMENGGSINNMNENSPNQWCDSERKKDGALFLGICDMRFATIGLNILHLISIFTTLFCQLFGRTAQSGYVAALIGILLSVVSTLGATLFSFEIMYLTTLGMIGLTVFYLVTVKIAYFILGCLLLYPQCSYLYEVRHGIMSKERYESGQEAFISEEGRIVMETSTQIANEVVESSRSYGNVAMTTTQKAARIIKEQSTRAMEQYVAPTLEQFKPKTEAEKCANSDSDSDESLVIVKKDDIVV